MISSSLSTVPTTNSRSAKLLLPPDTEDTGTSRLSRLSALAGDNTPCRASPKEPTALKVARSAFQTAAAIVDAVGRV